MEPLVTEESGFDLAKNQSQTIDPRRSARERHDQAAVDRGASDIHFETTPTAASGSAPGDGICHDYMQVQEHARARCIAQSRSWRAQHRGGIGSRRTARSVLKDKRGGRPTCAWRSCRRTAAYEDMVLRRCRSTRC